MCTRWPFHRLFLRPTSIGRFRKSTSQLIKYDPIFHWWPTGVCCRPDNTCYHIDCRNLISTGNEISFTKPGGQCQCPSKRFMVICSTPEQWDPGASHEALCYRSHEAIRALLVFTLLLVHRDMFACLLHTKWHLIPVTRCKQPYIYEHTQWYGSIHSDIVTPQSSKIKIKTM